MKTLTAIACCIALSAPAAAQYYDPFQPQQQPVNPWLQQQQPQAQPYGYQRRQGPTTYQQFGNGLTFDNQGNRWQQLGPYTFGSDGSVCQRLGRQVFCR